jgi:hypothetical protein
MANRDIVFLNQWKELFFSDVKRQFQSDVCRRLETVFQSSVEAWAARDSHAIGGPPTNKRKRQSPTREHQATSPSGTRQVADVDLPRDHNHNTKSGSAVVNYTNRPSMDLVDGDLPSDHPALSRYHQWTGLLTQDQSTIHTCHSERLRFLQRRFYTDVDVTRDVNLDGEQKSQPSLEWRLLQPVRQGCVCAGTTYCYVVAANMVLAHHPVLHRAAKLWSTCNHQPSFDAIPVYERACLNQVWRYQSQLRQTDHNIPLAQVRQLALLVTIINHTDSVFGCDEQQDCGEFLDAMLLLLFRFVCCLDPTNHGAMGDTGVIIWNYSAGQHWSVGHKWSLAHSEEGRIHPIALDTLLHLDVNQHKAHLRLDGVANSPAVLVLDINSHYWSPLDAAHPSAGPTSKHPQFVAPPDHLCLTTPQGRVLNYHLRVVVWHEGRSMQAGHYAAEVVNDRSVWAEQQGRWQPSTKQQPSRLTCSRRTPSRLKLGTIAKLLLYQLQPPSCD